jgi:hypothetical protein
MRHFVRAATGFGIISLAMGCAEAVAPGGEGPLEDASVPDASGVLDASGDAEPDSGSVARFDAGGADAHWDPAEPPLPNLVVRVEGTPDSMYFEPRGELRALHFQVEVANTGVADLVLGHPATSGHFGEIPCDGSVGVVDFLGWTLRSSGGAIVAEGTLPTSCLADDDEEGLSCGYQGLSAGQSSLQPRAPYCTFADITDVPPGEYLLEVVVNPHGAIEEETLEDNHAVVAFAMDEHDVCRDGLCGSECCYDDPCADGACDHLPDLAPYPEHSSADVRVTEDTFAPDSCVILEECVGGPGRRRLLRFSTTIANYGPGDLVAGIPWEQPDLFEWDPCHRHYHFIDFASYRLLHEDGRVAARGHKQAFCLFDAIQLAPGAERPRFTCGFQGISAGWGDVYRAGLDCQWIDITGVPPGRYLIEVAINEDHVLEEYDHTNNVERLPVTLYADGTACAPGDLPAGESCPPVE